MKFNQLPTKERLKFLLNYDPATGEFTWLISRGSKKAGAPAGHRGSDGYIRIKVDGILYRAHRLAWMFVTGDDPADLEVDHKNRARSDNRFSNLRLLTAEQNKQNCAGLGVAPTSSGKWQARLWDGMKNLYLGSFESEDEAREIYLQHKRQLHAAFT